MTCYIWDILVNLLNLWKDVLDEVCSQHILATVWKAHIYIYRSFFEVLLFGIIGMCRILHLVSIFATVVIFQLQFNESKAYEKLTTTSTTTTTTMTTTTNTTTNTDTNTNTNANANANPNANKGSSNARVWEQRRWQKMLRPWNIYSSLRWNQWKRKRGKRKHRMASSPGF